MSYRKRTRRNYTPKQHLDFAREQLAMAETKDEHRYWRNERDFWARQIQQPKTRADVSIAYRETDDGDQLWILTDSKGKWFSVEYETSQAELRRLANNFNREWEARVGQHLE